MEYKILGRGTLKPLAIPLFMGFFVFLGCQRVANSNKVANFCHL